MFAILIRSVVCELHVNAEIVIAQRRYDVLQNIAITARDAHRVALNRSLYFELRVL
jgi:hypothetical protein